MPFNRTRALALMAGLIAVACASFAAARHDGGKPQKQQKQDSDPTQVAATIVTETNAFRQTQGLKPLQVDEKLTAAAQKHAENMAREGKMSHELDGKGPSDRVRAEGYAFSVVEENVAVESGAQDPGKSAVEMWKKSPGHRRNMLSASVTEIGVGAAKGKDGKWYFCQDFGKPQNQGNGPAKSKHKGK